MLFRSVKSDRISYTHRVLHPAPVSVVSAAQTFWSTLDLELVGNDKELNTLQHIGIDFRPQELTDYWHASVHTRNELDGVLVVRDHLFELLLFRTLLLFPDK